MANYGKKLKELRKNSALSQKDLAIRIGITPPNLSQWESMAIPPLEGIMKVCEELGVPLWRFFREEEPGDAGALPDWIRPEQLAFLKELGALPEDAQKQLLEHFTGIIKLRKIL